MTGRGPITIHAGCIVVGEAGVLIRGAAGAGKSTLARELLAAAATRGLYARLVSDDRTRLAAAHGRVIARPVPAIAGLIEIRGLAIVRRDYEPAAVVRLVVDLVSRQSVPRLPSPEAMTVRLCGIVVPRLETALGIGDCAFVFDGLRHFGVA